MQLGGRIFCADRGLGVWGTPVWRCKVDRAVIDLHCHARGPVVLRRVLLDGDKRVRFHRVGRAVSEGDASVGVGAGLNEIALVERCAIVRFHPFTEFTFFTWTLPSRFTNLACFRSAACVSFSGSLIFSVTFFITTAYKSGLAMKIPAEMMVSAKSA